MKEKLCSYCDDRAVRGGSKTAFCLEHYGEMREWFGRVGWERATEQFERFHTKIRDVNFEEDD